MYKGGRGFLLSSAGLSHSKTKTPLKRGFLWLNVFGWLLIEALGNRFTEVKDGQIDHDDDRANNEGHHHD